MMDPSRSEHSPPSDVCREKGHCPQPVQSVLKNLSSMRRYCWQHGGEIKGGTCTQNYGFTVETDRYLYRLRCNPIEGDYQCYLSCFDKQAQKLEMCQTEEAPPGLVEELEPDEGPTMTMGGMMG